MLNQPSLKNLKSEIGHFCIPRYILFKKIFFPINIQSELCQKMNSKEETITATALRVIKR